MSSLVPQRRKEWAEPYPHFECDCDHDALHADCGLFVKVLLPERVPPPEMNTPEDYLGEMEGVWVIVTQGDKLNGYGILVSAPLLKSAKQGALVRYQTFDKRYKPVIVEAEWPWETFYGEVSERLDVAAEKLGPQDGTDEPEVSLKEDLDRA